MRVPLVQPGERYVQLRILYPTGEDTECKKIKTKLHLQLGALKEEVFYSNSYKDWTAMEDSPQEGFTGLTTPHFA